MSTETTTHPSRITARANPFVPGTLQLVLEGRLGGEDRFTLFATYLPGGDAAWEKRFERIAEILNEPLAKDEFWLAVNAELVRNGQPEALFGEVTRLYDKYENPVLAVVDLIKRREAVSA